MLLWRASHSLSQFIKPVREFEGIIKQKLLETRVVYVLLTTQQPTSRAPQGENFDICSLLDHLDGRFEIHLPTPYGGGWGVSGLGFLDFRYGLFGKWDDLGQPVRARAKNPVNRPECSQKIAFPSSKTAFFEAKPSFRKQNIMGKSSVFFSLSVRAATSF